MCLPLGPGLISQIQCEVDALIGIPLELQAPPRAPMCTKHWLRALFRASVLYVKCLALKSIQRSLSAL